MTDGIPKRSIGMCRLLHVSKEQMFKELNNETDMNA